jgi:hypothetical protein
MLVVLLPQDRRTISIWAEQKTSTITLLKKCIESQPHTIGKKNLQTGNISIHEIQENYKLLLHSNVTHIISEAKCVTN